MDRRDFIKASALTAGAVLISDKASALTGGTLGEITDDRSYLPNPGVKRQISGYGDLDIRKLKIKLGAKRPFSVFHMSDDHLVFTDSRNDEKKAKLAMYRHREFPYANLYHERLLNYAKEHKLPIIHTGDLIDFLSEMNLDYAVETFSRGDFIASVGNHEFAGYMGYFGKEVEDAAFQARSFDKVQEAFPNDLKFNSRIINGVNFVTLDDSFYFVTQEQWDRLAAELERGLPIVLLVHIPFYVPKLYADSSAGGTKFSYLCGAPVDTERVNSTTVRFVEWLKQQEGIKAILAGHMHEFSQEQFSPYAVQYVVGGACKGEAYHIRFV